MQLLAQSQSEFNPAGNPWENWNHSLGTKLCIFHIGNFDLEDQSIRGGHSSHQAHANSLDDP